MRSGDSVASLERGPPGWPSDDAVSAARHLVEAEAGTLEEKGRKNYWPRG